MFRIKMIIMLLSLERFFLSFYFLFIFKNFYNDNDCVVKIVTYGLCNVVFMGR